MYYQSSMLKWWHALKVSKPIKYLRYVRDELENQRQNRECIGEDRDGNKYYQYYSYYGLPTRREIRFKIQGDLDMKDLVYYRWLHKQEFDPPTEAEKEQFYLQEKIRFERALEWDSREKLLMEEFRQRREELLLRDAAMKELQLQMRKRDELTDIASRRR